MANITGKIARHAHISFDDTKTFFESLTEHIREFNKLGYFTEIQYQTSMQLNGKALFSAIILGREKEAE